MLRYFKTNMNGGESRLSVEKFYYKRLTISQKDHLMVNEAGAFFQPKCIRLYLKISAIFDLKNVERSLYHYAI